jgi:hypothetical protein
VERQAIEALRAAIAAAREVARSAQLDNCDIDDIEEIIAPAAAELEHPLPNVHTLSTYLNSLARSLRAQDRARSIVLQLDAAMRQAGVPTNWEH